MDKLTPKMEKFCQEMHKLGNQYQAYCKAYNTKKMKRATIDRCANKLMHNPMITTRLKELAEISQNKNIADAQEIQTLLTKLLRGEEVEEVPMMSEDGLIIAKKQITPKDRIKAGEMLAKMRGYFDIKIKIDNVPIIKDDI